MDFVNDNHWYKILQNLGYVFVNNFGRWHYKNIYDDYVWIRISRFFKCIQM